MAVFAVQVEPDNVQSKRFFDSLKRRLWEDHLVRNPFTGKVGRVQRSLYLLELRPVYPNPLMLGWILTFAAFILWGVSWILLPGLILQAAAFFWSKWFFYLILRLGLRKEGYKGKARLLKDQAALRMMVNGRWAR